MFSLYGLDYCPYCIKAVQLLEVNNIPHKKIWVKEADKDHYKSKHKMGTFPQIFYEPKGKGKGKKIKIGGFDDLEHLFLVARVVNKRGIDLKAIDFLSKNL